MKKVIISILVLCLQGITVINAQNTHPEQDDPICFNNFTPICGLLQDYLTGSIKPDKVYVGLEWDDGPDLKATDQYSENDTTTSNRSAEYQVVVRTWERTSGIVKITEMYHPACPDTCIGWIAKIVSDAGTTPVIVCSTYERLEYSISLADDDPYDAIIMPMRRITYTNGKWEIPPLPFCGTPRFLEQHRTAMQYGLKILNNK